MSEEEEKRKCSYSRGFLFQLSGKWSVLKSVLLIELFISDWLLLFLLRLFCKSTPGCNLSPPPLPTNPFLSPTLSALPFFLFFYDKILSNLNLSSFFPFLARRVTLSHSPTDHQNRKLTLKC